MLTLDIIIEWSQPTNPNGVITNYNATVYRSDDFSDIIYNDTILNTDLTVSVVKSVMVLPFTNYTVSVAASTIAGEGNAMSVTVLSPEAGDFFQHSKALSIYNVVHFPPQCLVLLEI